MSGQSGHTAGTFLAGSSGTDWKRQGQSRRWRWYGFVHPGYMAAAITLSGEALNLLHLYRQPIPPHLFWHRQDCYNVLKRWCDTAGAPHCPQGMDWPYFDYVSYSLTYGM